MIRLHCLRAMPCHMMWREFCVINIQVCFLFQPQKQTKLTAEDGKGINARRVRCKGVRHAQSQMLKQMLQIKTDDVKAFSHNETKTGREVQGNWFSMLPIISGNLNHLFSGLQSREC